MFIISIFSGNSQKNKTRKFINSIFFNKLWQIKLGHFGTYNFPSLNFINFNLINNNFSLLFWNYKSGLIASTKIYKLEAIKIIMQKRVFFSKGNQNRFVRYVKDKYNFNWRELAKKLNIREGTLKSYTFELCSIPDNIFYKMLKILGQDEDEILKNFNARLEEEIIVIGRKVLGELKKKFEDVDITFKNTNLSLDNSKVEYSLIDKKKNITFPNKITPELAEEIGMHYGDGFLSSRKYEYRLKGNQYNEVEYYKGYIAPLFKSLYNIEVNLKDYKTSYGFEISSKALWTFKTKVMEIKSGNKELITFPEVLKVNNLQILTSFIRGLFDTDGCLSFKTKYGYEKYYPEIKIALFSKKLILEIGEILKMLGFNPNVYINKDQGVITLNGIGSLRRYEKLIGWSSQKNLNKLISWKNRYSQFNENKLWRLSSNGLRCEPVALETRVRFPPSALAKSILGDILPRN